MNKIENYGITNCSHGVPAYTCANCRTNRDTAFYGGVSKERREAAMEAVIEFAWSLKKAKLTSSSPEEIERVKQEFIDRCRKVSAMKWDV